MNDFDFEELDKAVNQLGTKAQEELGGPGPVAAKPVVPAGSTAPAYSEPDTSAESEVVAPARSEPVRVSMPAKRRIIDSSSPVPKRRGAFMDIVPPNATPRKAPARVGVSLQPVSKAEEVVPEPPKPVEPEPSAVEEPAVVPEQPLAESPKASEHAEPKPVEPQAAPAVSQQQDVDWPDPLDFHDQPIPKVEEPTEQISPFLAEAKVEKRPLGAFSNFKPEPTPEPIVNHQLELEEHTSEPRIEDEPAPETEKAPLPPKSVELESEEASEPDKPDLHSAAMMSIPQQYRTEAKSTDKATRSVFDTKEYHPPLIEATAHEHRGGGSMWGKIFISFVVVALLAVAGYFVYLYFFM